MVDGFSIVDIIFLLLALFIGYKMYTMLGVRSDIEKKSAPKERFGFGNRTSAQKTIETAPLITGLRKIKTLDRTFNPDHFLEEVRTIFETVIKAFAIGDRDGLKNFISPELQDVFDHQIKVREDAHQTAELSFFRLVSAEILETTFQEDVAKVAVELVSEQILLIHDAEGKIVEGDPQAIDKVTDIWTFERNPKSKFSKWILVDMQTSDI